MFTGKKIFSLLKLLRLDTFNIELLQLQLQLLFPKINGGEDLRRSSNVLLC